MKTKFTLLKTTFFLGIFMFCLPTAFTQNWVQQTSGTTEELRKVFFIDENTGWALGKNQTFLRTEDGGDNWSVITISFGQDDLNYGLSFINENIGWISGQNGFLAKTIDGGNSWIDNSQGAAIINDIFFINQNVGWFSQSRSIFKTTNGGNSWTESCNGCQILSNFWDIHFVDASNGWGITQGGEIYRTVNGGASWTESWLSGISRIAFKIHFVNTQTGWFILGGNSDGYIGKTVNGGNTWSVQSFPDGLWDGSIYFIDENNGWLTGSGNIYHSTDGGATWITQETGLGRMHDIFFINRTKGWAVGRGGEIWHFECAIPPTNLFEVICEGESFEAAGVEHTETGVYQYTLPGTYGCDSVINLTLTVIKGQADAGENIVACDGSGNVQLNAVQPGPGITGKWTSTPEVNFSDTLSPTAIASNLSPGQYTFTWTLSHPVCPNLDSDQITVFVTPPAEAGDDQVACNGSGQLNAVSPGGLITGSWISVPNVNLSDPTSPTASFSNLTPGQTYYFTWTLSHPKCPNFDSDQISVFVPPIGVAGDDQLACNGSGQLNAVLPEGEISGQWASQPNMNFSDPASPTTTFRATPGQYTLTWTLSRQGCPDYHSDQTSVFVPPVADAGQDQVVCEGLAQLNALDPGPAATGRWTIAPSAKIVAPNNPRSLINDLIPGETHFLTWTLNNNECGDYSSDEILIFYENEVIEAEDDVFYFSEEPIDVNILDNDKFKRLTNIRLSTLGSLNAHVGTLNLDTVVNLGRLTYNNTEPTIALSRILDYKVENKHCPDIFDEARITINLFDETKANTGEEIQRVFTPGNQDGHNDTFIIPELRDNPGNFPKNSLVVINRWGEVVFEAQPYNNDWDGTHFKSGKALPVGTYFFIVRLSLADGLVQKGRVTLIR